MYRVMIITTLAIMIQSSVIVQSVTMDQDSAEHENYLKCIMDVTYTYAPKNGSIVISLGIDSEEDLLPHKLISKVHGLQLPVYVLTASDRKVESVYQYKSSFAIILVNNGLVKGTIFTLETQLKQLKAFPFLWNSKQMMIIALLNEVARPSMRIRRSLVNAAWRHRVVNFILMLKPVRLDYYKIYSAYPFSKGNCASKGNAVLLDMCVNGTLLFLSNDNYFSPKLPNAFPDCTLKVFTPGDVPPYVISNPVKHSTVPYSDGIEVRMINLIADIKRFTLDWIPINQIRAYLKESMYSDFWAETDGHLACNEVDVAFGSLRPTIERSTQCDMTNTYSTYAVSWFVPKATRDHSWIVRVNGVSMWLGLIGGYLLASLVILVLLNDTPKPGSIVVNMQSQFYIFYVLWSALESAMQYAIKHSTVKLFFFSWVMFQMRVQTSMMSSIVSILTQPNFGHQINTLQELLTSNMTICVLDESETCRSRFSEGDVVDMYRRAVVCPNMSLAMEQLIADRNVTILGIEDYLLSLSKQVKTNTHVMKEHLAVFSLGMFLRRDSFYLDAFNSVIRRAIQAGLPSKWRRDVRQRESSLARNPDDVFVSIKMKNINPIFRILVTGCIVSSFVFICELWFKYNPLNRLYEFVMYNKKCWC